MGSDLADMIFVDPPFNVAIEGHAGNFGSVHHREFMMASGEMSDTEYEAFLTQALSSLSRFSAEGSLHYICIDWHHISALLAAGRSNYTELKNLCVWAKQTLSYRVAVRIPIRSD